MSGVGERESGRMQPAEVERPRHSEVDATVGAGHRELQIEQAIVALGDARKRTERPIGAPA